MESHQPYYDAIASRCTYASLNEDTCDQDCLSLSHCHPRSAGHRGFFKKNHLQERWLLILASILKDSACSLGTDSRETVGPKLWRQGQLINVDDSFEITTGGYKGRGWGTSNETIIEGNTGIICHGSINIFECVQPADDLYSRYHGSRPVKPIAYHHSYIDHHGRALGLLPNGTNGDYIILIVTLQGFIDLATNGAISVGLTMSTQVVAMFGSTLLKHDLELGLRLATSEQYVGDTWTSSMGDLAISGTARHWSNTIDACRT
ncbi:hypothetical protein M409DRAFT_56633 [Zasmidium cellare ATCC 36951]|uniref:Uncharacterized protein n=1 Tax=Zasmidium cellare ATCC 36951 TaxID=1080233 RepID=A0A6A6CFA8_ZASCE|nr:uncharacterized protein M409DRAFT_56633 [Zasmidium cellare ATCC 36951]KAF2164359.1 hypothetical protein M409DRAFT_56633 [Zasmidium cellare ATCC 36951]